MKTYSPELQISGSRPFFLQITPKFVLLFSIIFLFLTIIPLHVFPLLATSLSWSSLIPSSSSNIDPIAALRGTKESCDIFKGEWVPNPHTPYYNETCWAIQEHQNCIKFGRPDTGFMKWRWRPDGCELPAFNPVQFLELMRGKSLAFVGDSVGRNQMQSLICLLLKVSYSVDASIIQDEKFRRFYFPDYNFTVATFWSPFLVRAKEADPNGPTLSGLFNLYLDEADANWTTKITEFDYVIVSVGHWFFRPAMFYENHRIVGCQYCRTSIATDLPKYYGYRMAFRTAFRAFNSLADFKGAVILRTFAPAHFENGLWNQGGDCMRRRPFRRDEARLEGMNFEMYKAQMEEFNAAAAKGRKKGVRFRLLDATEAMLLRPDGHPSRYGHPPNANVTLYNDCVHWCLPGPIDTWNEFLLHIVKSEGGRSATGRQSPIR
ncbi:hypothetical protein Cni_G26277 [Canna indica]|uniref:Trichome birefringence-like N-terminal domain-containing protein n=1 Tax=Canna indica TaxID=4628 RepID=A0AAQ3KZI1_9LILI|nr:hypothetical protein Cni_G26277 [Canna indica]